MTAREDSRPELAGHEELVLERAEGTSFTVRLIRAQDPTAPVLVILPAMGIRARYYARLAAALAAAGHQVAVGELRGHEAEGGRLPGRDYDFGYADLLDDLTATVAAVAEEFPDAPRYLLGHSLGGQLALLFAGRHPDRVAGVVTVGSGTVHWRCFPLPFLPLSQTFPLVARLVGHFPGRYARFAGREARTLIADWAGLVRTGRFAVADDTLDSVRLPVLAVSIDGDGFAPRTAVDGLMAKVPHARLTRVHLIRADLDHTRWARHPDSVVPMIGRWLSGVGG